MACSLNLCRTSPLGLGGLRRDELSAVDGVGPTPGPLPKASYRAWAGGSPIQRSLQSAEETPMGFDLPCGGE
jgi:hypothetical protein